ncbi:uncharacterized protein LOC143038122 isoform X2 [Oratosquilla oratoria]|uniref:uncharacterized protein LOC143038122 isoform X2 n=1 Tax=Oratosquilla oratoria TaxID=337810 RepID=UPI003F76FEC9
MSRRKQKFPVHLKSEGGDMAEGTTVEKIRRDRRHGRTTTSHENSKTSRQLTHHRHGKKQNQQLKAQQDKRDGNRNPVALREARVPTNGEVVLKEASHSIVPLAPQGQVYVVPVSSTNSVSVVVTTPVNTSSAIQTEQVFDGNIVSLSQQELSVVENGRDQDETVEVQIEGEEGIAITSVPSSAISLLTLATSAVAQPRLATPPPPFPTPPPFTQIHQQLQSEGSIQDQVQETSKVNQGETWPLQMDHHEDDPGSGNGGEEQLQEGDPARSPMSVEEGKAAGEQYPFSCPVCQEGFRSKRSFNAHIIVHCQMVNGTTVSLKRTRQDEIPTPSPDKKRVLENSINEHREYLQQALQQNDDLSKPLDLSCRSANATVDLALEFPTDTSNCEAPCNAPLQQSLLSERGPLEDENENLVNEAREREKAFFNIAQNEAYLTEDSTGLDPPPPLPLYGTSGTTRKIHVMSEEGPPMVYSVGVHAEQVVVSRILGINDETGDKMELYKCFMCSLAFPSVSRLQAHLSQHKQLFVCRKCNYSCDSRVLFSHHVQKEHLAAVVPPRSDLQDCRVDLSDDSCSAENTVTVAALLSALREKNQNPDNHPAQKSHHLVAPHTNRENFEEEDRGSDDSYPLSPSPESHETHDVIESNTSDDIFKMYSCRFCGKKFDRAFSCNRHERVHTGYKPCFCRVCGRGFSEPRNLRHHVIRFHSDGTLRHLIKRDRRKKGSHREDDSPTPISPVPPNVKYTQSCLKDVLKETANKLISNSSITIDTLTSHTKGLEITLASRSSNSIEEESEKITKTMVSMSPTNAHKLGTSEHCLSEVNPSETSFTSNLTRIITASLDNTTQNGKRTFMHRPSSLEKDGHGCSDELEPGEIRLDRRAKIIDDVELGRRVIVTAEDPGSEEGAEHSPQFSAYAPRLNIVQEPIDRDKALLPITDDIGRTFFECPYCHKLFGSTSDMNRHLDFHEDLRPYNCEYCEYSARTNSQLKVHKMRHEGSLMRLE